MTFPFFMHPVGYHTAMELRIAEGAIGEGRATAWLRMRMPLVLGQPTSPLCRVAIAADSGNGVSARLDWRRWLFINPDLTIHVHRVPRGEWVGLEAITEVEPHGIGLAASVLHDEDGPLGRGLQALHCRAVRGERREPCEYVPVPAAGPRNEGPRVPDHDPSARASTQQRAPPRHSARHGRRAGHERGPALHDPPSGPAGSGPSTPLGIIPRPAGPSVGVACGCRSGAGGAGLPVGLALLGFAGVRRRRGAAR